MTPTDVLNLTIRDAAAQIERSALSPVELTDAMLQRIARVGKTLNAYITVCGEQAREVALAAEKMIRPGITSARSTASPSPSRTTSIPVASGRPRGPRSWRISFPRKTPR